MVNVRRVMQARRMRAAHPRSGRGGVFGAGPGVIAGRCHQPGGGHGHAGIRPRDRTSPGERALQAGLVLAGLMGMHWGCSRYWRQRLGWLLLALGLAAAITGIPVAGRRIVRTRYRPDPWGWPETLTAATGISAAIAVIAVSSSTITIP